MDDFLALTDENSWDWIEADTAEQAVERYKSLLGYEVTPDELEPCWMARSEEQDEGDRELWDRVIGPDYFPDAKHGYKYEEA